MDLEGERLRPRDPEPQQEGKKPYEPRPKWQVWGARALLVIFLIGIVLYYLSVARRYA